MSIVMIHVGLEQVIGDLAAVDRHSITILPMTLWISPFRELSPVGRQRCPAVQFSQPALWTTAAAFDACLISEWMRVVAYLEASARRNVLVPRCLVSLGQCLAVWWTFQDPDLLSVASAELGRVRGF